MYVQITAFRSVLSVRSYVWTIPGVFINVSWILESASITALVNPVVYKAVKTVTHLFVNASIPKIVMSILTARKG